MRMCLRVASFVALALLVLTTTARADGSDRRGGHPSLESPIFDITHFDVIPLTINGVDFLHTAYAALFK